ncbi:MAG: sigma 54-interacting transcriptional regulator [Candidatus Competibacteraceae bacterium]
MVQFMVATALFAMALLHLFVGLRDRTGATLHRWLALTMLAAGTSAWLIGEFYQAPRVADFILVFKGSTAGALLWRLTLVPFVVAYTGLQAAHRRYFLGLGAFLLGLLCYNALAPAGLVYAEITDLREITLPWGERIQVAAGPVSAGRFLLELADSGFLVLILLGCRQLWRRGERRRAGLFGGSLFLLLFGFDAYSLLIDLGWMPPPYLSTAGFLVLALGLSYDLFGRLAMNERRWRSMPATVQALVASTDHHGVIQSVNPWFETVSGYFNAQLVGQPLSRFLSKMEPSGGAKVPATTLTGAPFSLSEWALRSRDGMTRILLCSASEWPNLYGDFTGTLLIGIDITAQRQAEAARDATLQQLQEALRELTAAKARLEDQVVSLQQELQERPPFEEMIGQSEALRRVQEKIEQVAPSTLTVLIEGETGVGKELVVRAIHRRSSRRDRPLIKVNCAALPPTLIEAELFGYEKGAFTGAGKTHKGYFELAHGGTLLLDEIGELPLELQPKLLEFLQTGEFERIGGERPRQVDVRVITATNRKLAEEVKHGRFRQDLYYRLNVYTITVPPLRQRREDIPLLATSLVKTFARMLDKPIARIPQAIMDQFLQYDWPGNIRELENVLKRAVLTTSGDQLQLNFPLVDSRLNSISGSPDGQATLEQIERDYIVRILRHCEGRIEGPQGAAKVLGLNPSTMRSRLRKLGIKASRNLSESSGRT